MQATVHETRRSEELHVLDNFFLVLRNVLDKSGKISSILTRRQPSCDDLNNDNSDDDCYEDPIVGEDRDYYDDSSGGDRDTGVLLVGVVVVVAHVNQ